MRVRRGEKKKCTERSLLLTTYYGRVANATLALLLFPQFGL